MTCVTEWGLGSGKVRQLITAGRAEACWGVGAGPHVGTHRLAVGGSSRHLQGRFQSLWSLRLFDEGGDVL